MSDSLQLHEPQQARPPCPSPTPRVHPNSCASNQWCHADISSSSSPSPAAPNHSQHQDLFQWVNSLHEVAKVLEFQPQHHSFQRNPRADLLQNGLAGGPSILWIEFVSHSCNGSEEVGGLDEVDSSSPQGHLKIQFKFILLIHYPFEYYFFFAWLTFTSYTRTTFHHLEKGEKMAYSF